MIIDLLSSSVTFKKCTVEKLTFIILNLIDLGLTLLAVSLGAEELNPVMRSLIAVPVLLYLFKGVVPIVIAWVVPGKLLLPAIAALTFVVGWDLQQMAALLF